MKGNDIMKTTDNKLSTMTDERISELQNFQTKDFTDCPVQTSEQLQEFKPVAAPTSLATLSLDEQIVAAALKRNPRCISLPTDENGNVIIDKEKYPDIYDWAANG